MPSGTNGVRREVRKREEGAIQRGKWGCFTPQSLSWGQGRVTGDRRRLGGAVVKSWGHGEEWKRSKMMILEKWQKVFVVGLGKKINSNCHENYQDGMAHRSRVFHQFWAHLGKVANVTLVNPRNQQKWLCQDLVMQIYSPWCTTWCSVIIWGSE